MKVTGPLFKWFVNKRRMYAAERMESLWTCWGVFLYRLHKPSRIGPPAIAQYQFKDDVVWVHQHMVGGWLWRLFGGAKR